MRMRTVSRSRLNVVAESASNVSESPPTNRWTVLIPGSRVVPVMVSPPGVSTINSNRSPVVIVGQDGGAQYTPATSK
jgi:hypothetical protein